MLYHVRVSNFLTVAHAEIPLTPGRITAVCGPNASGKTSIATAIAAVLSHNPNPFDASVAQAKQYVRDGEESGDITLFSDAGEPLVKWPLGSKGLVKMAEARPPATAAAVGLVDFIHGVTKPQQRTDLWEGYFLPPVKDLLEKLRKELKAKVDPKIIDGVMETIASDGWEAVSKIYKARATEASRAWTKITGVKWGKNVGGTWHPEEWVAEFDGVSPEKADEDLADAKAALQARHVENAISQGEAERASEAEDELAALAEALEKITKDLGVAERAHQAKEEELADMRRQGAALRSRHQEILGREPKQETIYPCPGCSKSLYFAKGGLVIYDDEEWKAAWEAWKKEADDAKADVDGMLEDYEKADAAAEPLRKVRNDLKAAYDTARSSYNAVKMIVDRGQGTVETEEMQEALKDAEHVVDRKRKRYEHIKRHADAFAKHESIVEYLLIAEVLGPTGVRGQEMKEQMDLVDQVLDPVSQITGWPRVKLDSQYAVSIASRKLLRVCAESEQLRAQYSLQMAVARVKRDDVLILDKADHLDARECTRLRKVLRMMLSRADPPAVVVCGTDFDPARWGDEAHRVTLDGKGGASVA